MNASKRVRQKGVTPDRVVMSKNHVTTVQKKTAARLKSSDAASTNNDAVHSVKRLIVELVDPFESLAAASKLVTNPLTTISDGHVTSHTNTARADVQHSINSSSSKNVINKEPIVSGIDSGAQLPKYSSAASTTSVAPEVNGGDCVAVPPSPPTQTSHHQSQQQFEAKSLSTSDSKNTTADIRNDDGDDGATERRRQNPQFQKAMKRQPDAPSSASTRDAKIKPNIISQMLQQQPLVAASTNRNSKLPRMTARNARRNILHRRSTGSWFLEDPVSTSTVSYSELNPSAETKVHEDSQNLQPQPTTAPRTPCQTSRRFAAKLQDVNTADNLFGTTQLRATTTTGWSQTAAHKDYDGYVLMSATGNTYQPPCIIKRRTQSRFAPRSTDTVLGGGPKVADGANAQQKTRIRFDPISGRLLGPAGQVVEVGGPTARQRSSPESVIRRYAVHHYRHTPLSWPEPELHH